ncbi:hypothetical protein PUMCH_000318 [Australozyma saopauloensis]|uniref:Protein kinase domain-containing protein n=1 Tax=Australozyma saopauloensis TaxID=291208 RepID=A0AAX4H3I7_9ASCO|nr:hypothetical protein PUMCH_000318 [[Candida] saopauloensis]
MSNISPGLRNRFAGIELEMQVEGKLPKKPISKSTSYNLSSSTSFTTPCKAPQLSTAKRADSRTSSASKITSSAPSVSKRPQPNTNRNSCQISPSQGRENRTARNQDMLQFSFMRETSSSRKKQSTMPMFDKPFTHTRSTSHSDLNQRKNYAQHSGKKRLMLKNLRPADITNNYTSSNNALGLEVSQYYATDISKNAMKSKGEDVYTRLYNSASKSRERLPDLRVDVPNNTPFDFRLKPETPNFTKSRSLNNFVEVKQTSSLDPRMRKPNKVRTVFDFCQLVYESEPQLFEDSHSLDLLLHPNEPILPHEFIDSRQARDLSIFERGEIMRASTIYYVPERYSAGKRNMDVTLNNSQNNYGFDDLRGNYIISMNDHIDYRYEIIKTLGTGSFGSVVLCIDHKYASETKIRKVAIKIIKNKLDWSLQAVSEIKILKHLMKALNGPFEDFILNYCDHFHFRGHMCIVSEALAINLYQFLKLNYHRGVSLRVTKYITKKILEGLTFIHKMNIVHCDIKPENIMVEFPADFEPLLTNRNVDLKVKIIDFGSSCFKNDTMYTYIQSRFYRAPEVIFGTEYGPEIDVWSVGCLAAELFTGSPLLPGKSEIEQIAYFLEMFGAPSSKFVLRERNLLQKALQVKGLRVLSNPQASDAAPFIPSPKDERKLRRTPLFSLFGIDGKINLQAVTLQLQGSSSETRESHLQSPTHFRRNVKVSSRPLDVTLRLPTSSEDRIDQTNFQSFLASIFCWDYKDRASSCQLLSSAFLDRTPSFS